MSKLLTLSGDIKKFSVSISQDAQTSKNKAIELSGTIKSVKSGEQQTQAVAVVQNLKSLLKQTEAMRKELKQPFLDAGRDIDARAKEFCKELEAESKRIEAEIGVYQQKIRSEQALEVSALDKKKFQLDYLRANEPNNIDEISELEIDIAESNSQVINTVSGASVQMDYDIEVEDIHKLYAAYPRCVKLEPRMLEIRDLIKSGIKEIAGVKIIPKTKVAVKSK